MVIFGMHNGDKTINIHMGTTLDVCTTGFYPNSGDIMGMIYQPTTVM